MIFYSNTSSALIWIFKRFGCPKWFWKKNCHKKAGQVHSQLKYALEDSKNLMKFIKLTRFIMQLTIFLLGFYFSLVCLRNCVVLVFWSIFFCSCSNLLKNLLMFYAQNLKMIDITFLACFAIFFPFPAKTFMLITRVYNFWTKVRKEWKELNLDRLLLCLMNYWGRRSIAICANNATIMWVDPFRLPTFGHSGQYLHILTS